MSGFPVFGEPFARRFGASLGVMGGGGVPPIDFNLLHLTFPTDYAAGTIPSPYGEGHGTITVVDSGANLSVVSGVLYAAHGGVSSWTDPQWYSDIFSASGKVGLAFYHTLVIADTSYGNGTIGLSSLINANPVNPFMTAVAFNQVNPAPNTGQLAIPQLLGTISVVYSTPWIVEEIIVCRVPGAIWLQRTKNGQYMVMWVDDAISNANLRARMSNINTGRPYGMKEVGVSDQLPAVWQDRYGIATAHAATTSDGSTAVMTSDAIVEHKITAQTGVTQELMVRRVDDNNCWIIRMDQAGSTIKLIEKVAGVETEQSSAAQTWTNATVYRIVVTCDGYVIRAYVGQTYKVGYISARTNATATGVAVSHAGTELVTWPRRVDLNAGTPVVAKSFLAYGDSKTNGQGDDTPPILGQNGWPYLLAQGLTASTGQTWHESPIRVGVSSTTVALRKAAIDTDVSTRYGVPDYVICGLGVNDGETMGGDQALWVSNYQYIIDTFHFLYPNARVGIIKQCTSGGDFTVMNDTAIPLVMAGRDWTFIAADERMTLKPTGTYTVDGVHPNHAGYVRQAAAIQTAMGY